jgi:hypothetical protein
MQLLRTLVAGAIALVVAFSQREHPAPSLHGDGSLVLVALLVLVLSTATLVRGMRTDRARLFSLGALTAASSTLVWIQHGGPGIAGLFVGVSYAAIALPTRRSLPVLALAVIELPILIAHAHEPTGRIAAVELSIVAYYIVASVVRRAREADRHTKALLEQSQGQQAARYVLTRDVRSLHGSLANSLSSLSRELASARGLAAGSNGAAELTAVLERAHDLARAGADLLDSAISTLTPPIAEVATDRSARAARTGARHPSFAASAAGRVSVERR